MNSLLNKNCRITTTRGDILFRKSEINWNAYSKKTPVISCQSRNGRHRAIIFLKAEGIADPVHSICETKTENGTLYSRAW